MNENNDEKQREFIEKKLENCPRPYESNTPASLEYQANKEKRDPKILSQLNELVNLAIQTNVNHVFAQNIFPNIKTSSRPFDLLYAILYYANNINKTFNECLEMMKVNPVLWNLRIRIEFPEFENLKNYCTHQRIELYNSNAISAFNVDDIPDEFYEETKFGRRFSSAGANFLVKKSEMWSRQAKIAERGQHNVKQEITHTHQVIQQPHKEMDLDKIMTTPIDQLISGL